MRHAVRLPQVLLFALTLAVLVPSTAQAQKRRDKGKRAALPEKIEPWIGDFDSARDRAKARNSPLVVVALLEGEQTSDRVRDEIYKSKEFLKASMGTVVLLVNDGDHPKKTIEVTTSDGTKVERNVCSVYETPGCSDHQRSWNRVYQEFHINGEIKMPHLLALLPDGKIQGRYMDEIQKGESLQLLDEAKKTAGPSLTMDELTRVRAALEEGANMEKTRLWSHAWRAFTRALEITDASQYAAGAEAGAQRAIAKMQGQVEEALALFDQQRVDEGYGRLLELREEFTGTPLEKRAKDAVRKVERDKRYKDTIRAFKRRADAEALWVRCMQALDNGRERSAERHASELIKKYADTPAGKRAAERFPHLVPIDGEGGGLDSASALQGV